MELFQPGKMQATRFLFFTGKGGVGKTSVACATAVALADAGKKVLIVSTDPASNLDDVFETEIDSKATPIPHVENLDGINLDPDKATEAYKENVVGPYRDKLPQAVVASIEEQLSGACTVEIATFDEFTKLLAEPVTTKKYDHVIFDTAPTGHTLRLLQLPMAWSGFLEESQHGASCLGPLAGLAEKKDLYTRTMQQLADPTLTTLLLVSRPERIALAEAARAAGELKELGISNQKLIINGILQTEATDAAAFAFRKKQEQALDSLPEILKAIPTTMVPLVPFDLTGVMGLRHLFEKNEAAVSSSDNSAQKLDLPSLNSLVDQISQNEQGIVLTMGKGGVGKTTIAAAIAVALAEKGLKVHLTTTDPAAHLSLTLGNDHLQENLLVSRIDPKSETETYRQEILAQVGPTLDREGLELLKEDLASPCTEEIAVFRAFAREVDKVQEGFVILDTAPTGHTLLLLDAAESYHREVQRTTGEVPESVKKLLPRLRNPEQTHVVLVTLAEATPVLETSRLQQDLRRAGIETEWWVINQSWQTVATSDPVLLGRAKSEISWLNQIQQTLANKYAVVPWQVEEPTGREKLMQLGTNK